MAPNPYRKVLTREQAMPTMATRRRPRTGTVMTSNSEQFFDNGGEINASSKNDLLQALGHLVSSFGSNQVVRTPQAVTAEVQQQKEENLALLREAFHDMKGGSWQVLGETIGDEIYETLGREGFARRIFLFKSTGQGEVAQFYVHKKDVQGWITSEAGNITPSIAKNYYLYPEDMYITCAVSIEDRDIAQASIDLLDRKYQDGLEQIMVKEDQMARGFWNDAVGVANPEIFFPTFTPTVFSRLRTSILQWGIQPVSTAIIAWDLWNDIIANVEFSNWFDPVTKRDLIMDGMLGSILDVNILTDAFRYSTLRVLQDGEVFMFGPPETLGVIAERVPLMTKPTDQYDSASPFRGWFMELIEAMALGNARALAKGQRV